MKVSKNTPRGQKGENGRVLVVGGSKEYSGSVYLAAMAAARSGADSVMVMAPEKVAWAINALSPDLVTKKLKGRYLNASHRAEILHQLETADVLLIGNGAGVKPQTARLICSIVKTWQGLKVVDADAIKALKDNLVQNAILTPNPNEYRLLQEHNNLPALLEKNNVILIKGRPVKVLSYEETTLKNIDLCLTKAGIGDIIAGLAAGFLAQSKNLRQSAIDASRTVSEIGARAIKKRGRFYMASDLLGEVEKLKVTY